MKERKILGIILVSIVTVLLFVALGITIHNKVEEKNKKYSKEKVIEVYKTVKYDEKVNAYLFHGDGCPHCKNEISFLDNLDSEYKEKYNLYKFETWDNENNQELRKLVVNQLIKDGYIVIEVENSEEIEDITTTEEYKKKLERYYNSVPFIVIGDKQFIGYGDNTGDYIKEAILVHSDYDVMKKLDLK